MSDEETKLTTKQWLISLYLLIAVGFTFYNWLFGAENYRGFFFNMGKALAWPVQIFPMLGQVFGLIFLLAVIGAAFAFGPRQKDQ